MTRVVIACALLSVTVAAEAQTPADRTVRRLEVAVGPGWLGGAALGGRDAELRTNTLPAQPFRLFRTETRLAGAPAADLSVGVALTRRWSVEGALLWSRPELQSSVSDDVEGAPALTVVERIDQYVVEGRVIVLFDEAALGTRTVPFVSAGAGYLRQLHEGRTFIEEGHVYHVGGGLKHWLRIRDTGRVRAIGLRADVRLYLLAAGIAFDDGPRPHPAVSGALFVTF